jgi:hypothetical protein
MVSRFGDDLDSVIECHTNWLKTVETTPAFLGALDQFQDHRERRPVRQIAVRSVRLRTVAKPLSMGLVVRKCFQCSAGNVESEQRVSLLGQAVGRPVVFQGVAFR